jgi:glycosyltransferase involved in cell wall biosynthesis
MTEDLSHSPKISVILPNYNHDQYLRQSIESILVQTYRDFELIIVDDGSIDDSWAIIREYADKDARIIAEKFPMNRGVEAAIKRCCELCRGELLFGRGSDDYLIDPNFFQQVVDVLALYPDAAGAFAGSLIIDGKTGKQYATMGLRKKAEDVGRSFTVLSKDQAREQFLSHNLFIPGASAIWKRSLMEQAGGYDMDLGPQSDYFLNHALPMLNGVVEIHSYVGVVRGNLDSYSAVVESEAFFRRHALVEKKTRTLVKEAAHDEGWVVWRRGIITNRIPDPVDEKEPTLQFEGTSLLIRIYRKIQRKLKDLRRWRRMRPIQRRRARAHKLFEKVVQGRDTH